MKSDYIIRVNHPPDGEANLLCSYFESFSPGPAHPFSAIPTSAPWENEGYSFKYLECNIGEHRREGRAN